MKLSTFLSTASILPALASASLFDFLEHSNQNQVHLSNPSPRLDRSPRPSRVQKTRQDAAVLVGVVDPATPTTSTVVTPASIARQALDYSPDDEDEDEDDSPNFGARCDYEQGNPFSVCGDYFDEASQTDHGLFCSPRGICAGKGAVCGTSQACADGLTCNLSNHRCELSTALSRSISQSRKHSRQRTALSMCPDAAQACSSSYGGFECVFTDSEVTQCGGCLNLGGVDCSAIENALATSCRRGTCKIHACVGGFLPSEDGTECVDELLL
ncbi:hypothetical protein JCM11491_003363 [Sporobolomyces phaffii]